MATTFKKFTSFSLLSSVNTGLDIDINANIEENVYDIVLPIPIERNFENLIPSFTFVGGTVTANGIPQTSGISENDYIDPLVYTITAEDGSTQDYTVYVKHMNIQDTVPAKFALRVKQIFDVFNKQYADMTYDAMQTVQNIYNPEYDLDPEIVDIMLDLFGFYLGDLTYFDDETLKKLKNLFLDNVFTIYRNKLKEQVFQTIFYIYGLKGNVYALDTVDWESYSRSDYSVYVSSFDIITDIGLTTDMEINGTDIRTDNAFRTPFIEVEILLEKPFTNNTLWFENIDANIKTNFDSIRHVLSKLFYTLKAVCVGENRTTTTNENGMIIFPDDVIDIAYVNEYVLYLDDGSTIVDIIDDKKTDDDGNFHFYIKHTFDVDAIINKIELRAWSGRVYVTIDSPDMFFKADSNFDFTVSVTDSGEEVPLIYSYGLYSYGYFS